MTTAPVTLLTWHAARAGLSVSESAIQLLGTKGVRIKRVHYLVQSAMRAEVKVPPTINGVPVDVQWLDVSDPTDHDRIYHLVCDEVIQRVRDVAELHINISPGTPAMHAVWMILFAGGVLPLGTKLWSTQLVEKTGRQRISLVDFEINTYLGEIRRRQAREPQVAQFDPAAKSERRKQFMERLRRYGKVPGAPLLLLGERGTGKTRAVETIVGSLRSRKVEVIACGALDSALAESHIFGHVKGAFTGAVSNRDGAIKKAKGKILFLDEVQDLPKTVQRKLVRVLQDEKQRYSPVGSDKEDEGKFDLVCASNRTLGELQQLLDPDLFDRLAHLIVSTPPLRECREDIEGDWQKTWNELRRDKSISEEAPWNPGLRHTLEEDRLSGNFRDLQRLALLCMAWDVGNKGAQELEQAIADWKVSRTPDEQKQAGEFYDGTREERTRCFQRDLAEWAHKRFGTMREAARVLACNERTLREDKAFKQ